MIKYNFALILCISTVIVLMIQRRTEEAGPFIAANLVLLGLMDLHKRTKIK